MKLTYEMMQHVAKYARDRSIQEEEKETTIEGYKTKRDERDAKVILYCVFVKEVSNDPQLLRQILQETGWQFQEHSRELVGGSSYKITKGRDW